MAAELPAAKEGSTTGKAAKKRLPTEVNTIVNKYSGTPKIQNTWSTGSLGCWWVYKFVKPCHLAEMDLGADIITYTVSLLGKFRRFE